MSLKTPVGKPLLLSGATLVDPVQKIEKTVDILLENGEVSAVGKPGELSSKAKSLKAEQKSAKGLHAAPGLIDLHANVYEPGGEYVEGFDSASMAAAAGGFTALCVKPNTTPVNDNAFMTDLVLRRAKERSSVRIFPVGALTTAKEGKKLAEIGGMAAAGVRALSDGSSLADSYLMRKALEYARTFRLPIFCLAEDRGLVGQGVMNEGFNSNRLGLRGIPAAAEEIMVSREIILARHTQGRVHFHSVSTKGAVEQIRRAKDEGVQVTAETNPQYFTLTSDAIASYDANYKCFPPLRSDEDVEAVVEALADGTIDAVASAHTPQTRSSKELAFESASAGMIGLETAFSMVLGLVAAKKITLPRAIELLSAAPAKILGLEKSHGTLAKGAIADLVLFDPKEKFVFHESRIHSASRNTPFLGRTMQGTVQTTIVNGSVVWGKGREQ